MSLDTLKNAIQESGLADDVAGFSGEGVEEECIFCEWGCIIACKPGCPLFSMC